jgi:hypothetical protein
VTENPDASTQTKDGRDWRIGTAGEVEWIRSQTHNGITITSGVPALFDAYGTLVFPDEPATVADNVAHTRALIDVLVGNSTDQTWLLGYLDRGPVDVIFPDAPRVVLYASWSYVLVEAGPDQAATWRTGSVFSKECLPDLMFPAGRSWLVSTLWDDDWSCIGGSTALIEAFAEHPLLRSRFRRVTPDMDMTPPGRVMH